MPEIKKQVFDAANDIFSEAKEEFAETVESNNKKRKKHKKKKTTLIMVLVVIALFVLCVALLAISFSIKKDAVQDAYNSMKSEARDTAYAEMGQKIFNIGEKRYHVGNEVGITVKNLENVSSLEALEITEIYYHIDEGKEKTKSQAWYKVTGTGVYTVNMELAEIITDDERNYILIRVPSPTLQTDDFDVTVEQFHFENKNFEEVEAGEEIAVKAEKEGYKNIKSSILSNQDYFNCAKNAAESQLIKLAKECNPDIEIEADVEFF